MLNASAILHTQFRTVTSSFHLQNVVTDSSQALHLLYSEPTGLAYGTVLPVRLNRHQDTPVRAHTSVPH